MSEEGKRHLLILSDMHLGRDCNYITGFNHITRPNPAFDRAFIDLVDHYTSGRESEWKIIFAGDFIDFIEVVVVPSTDGSSKLNLTFDVTDEERVFGLGTEQERVLVKLEKTMDYHRDLFTRIASFVERGGEIVLLRGNHDVEFFWRKAQRAFRRRLSSLAFRGRGLDVDEAIDRGNQFQERIAFVPWIYYEPGRVYVEHGHQYDVYCSFDNQLHPVSPTHPRRIDMPISAFAMRYFVNMMKDYAAHNADVWSTRDYANWLLERGVGGALYITQMGLRTGYRLLAHATQFALGFRVRRYQREHDKKLAEEAEKMGVPEERLRAIDALHHRPINKNPPELMRLLFLDRILLAAGSLALTLLVLLVVEDAWIELGTIALVAILAHRMNKHLAPRRYLLPGPKQAAAAQAIADALDVKTVIMGHSHVRRLSDLGHGRMYVNAGSWLPPVESVADHTDASSPCTCKLAHVVIEGDAKAELRMFCKVGRTVRLSDVRMTDVRVGDREPDILARSGSIGR